jgi:protocatechuate 3,4-dioxygenase beta subunit
MRTRLAYPLLVIVTLAACQPAGDRRTAAPATPTAAPAPAVGCPIPVAVPVAAAAVLVPGPVNGVPRSTAPPGERLTVTATVLDPACRPAPGADITLWHTDSAGLYGPDREHECCYYGGTVETDANGRFQLDTIVPARYPAPGAPPSHIHFELRHPSGSLDTEITFGPGAQSGPVRPAHVLPVELIPADGGWRAEVTFVLE